MHASNQRPEPAIRRYRTLGLDADARVALRSMMEVLQGRAHADWHACEQDDADVYFVGSHAVAPYRQGNARQIVHVVRHGEGHAGYAHHVDYPFRVFQLLSVLLEVEEEANAGTGARALPVSHPSWALFDSLHRLGNEIGSGKWLRLNHVGDAGLFVRDDLQEVALSPAMELALTAGRIPPFGLVPSASPPADMARRGPESLLWCVGLHAGRGSLSDAIDPGLAYRLRAWPDFDRLPPANREHLHLCTVLASTALRRDELVDELDDGSSTRLERLERVNRFLNACAASGLLKAEHRSGAPVGAQAGFVAGLLSRVRTRLGIAPDVA